MYFKRKAYNKLLEWKEYYSDKYAALLEGARRVGKSTNRKLMRDLRIYMAVGGMPQAVEAYVEGKNFSEIDMVKRQIISLYEQDFKKIDESGRELYYHTWEKMGKEENLLFKPFYLMPFLIP